MKYLSLFSGIGGFEVGLKEHRCVGYSEINKYAIQIYEKHFNHKKYGDVTKIKTKELPKFDLIVGGFPCQSFSVAGKRGGFLDTRGTLFFEIARIAREKQPRLLLLENVKGLLSHGNGHTFYTVISTLEELGYDLQWQVLNSKDFGVPQNRERVFIIGHLRGTARPEIFPFFRTNEKDTQARANGPQRQKISGIATRHLGRNGGLKSPIASTLQAAEVPHILSKTVRSGSTSSPYGSKQNWDSYEFDGKIRRLTPKECERLQGFPDGWTEGVSDSQRYKCLGNAVTVNVVKEIIKKLL